jgi:hypothetical protein
MSHAQRQDNFVVDYLANVAMGHPHGESQWLCKDVGQGDFRDNITHFHWDENPPPHVRIGGEPRVHIVGLSEAQVSI